MAMSQRVFLKNAGVMNGFLALEMYTPKPMNSTAARAIIHQLM